MVDITLLTEIEDSITELLKKNPLPNMEDFENSNFKVIQNRNGDDGFEFELYGLKYFNDDGCLDSNFVWTEENANLLPDFEDEIERIFDALNIDNSNLSGDSNGLSDISRLKFIIAESQARLFINIEEDRFQTWWYKIEESLSNLSNLFEGFDYKGWDEYNIEFSLGMEDYIYNVVTNQVSDRNGNDLVDLENINNEIEEEEEEEE